MVFHIINVMLHISVISIFIDFEYLQNSQVCYEDVVHVLSEHQAIVEFYNEITAAILKCYMLLQMTYMVQTINDLGKNE